MKIEHDTTMRIYDRNGLCVHDARTWETTAAHLASALQMIERLRSAGNKLADIADQGEHPMRNVLLREWDKACEYPVKP